MLRASSILLLILFAATSAAPVAGASGSSGSETQEYYAGNGVAIVYASNYLVPTWDVGGNRFRVTEGASTMSVTVDGGPSTTFVDYVGAGGVVLGNAFFCGNHATLDLPLGSLQARIFVGTDASYPNALYPHAPTCGVLTPPAHGFITAKFA